MSQKWIYDDGCADSARIRLAEMDSSAVAGEGGIVVGAVLLGFPQPTAFQGCNAGDPIQGQVVGVVRASRTNAFSEGDWVSTTGPWQQEFSMSHSSVVKINPQLDDPLDYLNVLSNDAVSLYLSARNAPRGNQSVACVLGCDSANGLTAATLLKAMGYVVLAVASTNATADKLRSIGLGVDWIHSTESVGLREILQQEAIDFIDTCVDCAASELSSIFSHMSGNGTIVLWHTTTSTTFTIPPCNITIKAISHVANQSSFSHHRAVMRDLLHHSRAAKVWQVQEGFDQMASMLQSNNFYIAVKASEDVIPTARLPIEAVALHRRIAEIDESLPILQDTQVHAILNNRAASYQKQLDAMSVRSAPVNTEEVKMEAADATPAGPAAAVSSPVAEAKTNAVAVAPPLPTGAKFIPIDSFAWDQGEYNSPTVSVYVELPGVGAIRSGVSCYFNKDSFDLRVEGLSGKNYRLFRDNLEKDIIPDSSSYVVKSNKIVVKLRKVKGEYSYEHWSNLTAKRKREEKKDKDPMGGIMDLMRDMYEDGDSQTKKLIGEAMMKAQRGEKDPSPKFDDI